jgi:hypothetical protein
MGDTSGPRFAREGLHTLIPVRPADRQVIALIKALVGLVANLIGWLVREQGFYV